MHVNTKGRQEDDKGLFDLQLGLQKKDLVFQNLMVFIMWWE